MFLKHLHLRLAKRGLAPVAILVSALLSTPAVACKNPAFAPMRAATTSAPGALMNGLFEDDPAPQFGDFSIVEGAADYSLVTNDGNGSIVGMWHAILRIGDASGPVYDEVFQQFHSDGTEMIISNGLPPALGNVCVGVWKRTEPRTYKLRHMTWNWSPETGGFGVPGTFAGHFELQVRLRLDSNGNAYRGSWKAQNFDLEGNHLPELDAEGVVTARRITVN